MNRNLILLITIACSGFGVFGPSSATAQAVPHDSAAATVKLFPEQLKAFEGFQSSQNKDNVVQFSAIDKDGIITQVLAFKRDVWIKTNNPALTPAILKTYEGKYRSDVDPDNEIIITATDSNLVVRQLWDKKDRVLQPLTEIYFNNQDRAFPLVIVKDQQGKVSQVVLLTGNIFKKLPE